MERSGVALTDFLNAYQIKKHMSSLNKNTVQEFPSKNTCRLCAKDKLMFTLPSITCSSCKKHIECNADYYRTDDKMSEQVTICMSCFEKKSSRMGEKQYISKCNLREDKNEPVDEPWVRCDKCKCWQHQICALYNEELDLDKKKEYICPICRLNEKQVDQKSIPTVAKNLPKTKLSDHLESRLFESLRQEKKTTESRGEYYDDVSSFVVRVVLADKEQLKVKQQFLNIFKGHQYPAEFPYKSKVILLFQNIEGVDVCLFAMYVQEFGSDCREPNSRCVYISYLDSVNYFIPKRKTIAGESLRTFVYHEILIGYLDYCKNHGYTTCYIWACPPQEGDDYIFYCHPNEQLTPNQNKLCNWYKEMIKKALEKNVVVDCIDFYDHFFGRNAKITAARLPYFHGAYWTDTAEDLIEKIEEGTGGGSRKMKMQQISQTKLKSMGHTEFSDKERKDAMVMKELGKNIKKSEERFFILGLQFTCTNCQEVILSGSRWSCKLCKNFHLCKRCHQVKNHQSKRRYPCGKNHPLSKILVNDIPSSTEDNDFIKDRSTFLQFCMKKHFQFNTFRNAKHSSMMILYHLHKKIALTGSCSICHKTDSLTWHRITSEKSYMCFRCYEKDCEACRENTHVSKANSGTKTNEELEDDEEGEIKAKKILETPDRRNKRKLGDSQQNSPSKRKKSQMSGKTHSSKIQICDLDPSDIEMTKPYMDGVHYTKLVQPNNTRDGRRNKSRKENLVDRSGVSGKSGSSGVKKSTLVCKITDGRTGHAVVSEDDEDFADPPPRRQEKFFHVNSPTGKGASADPRNQQESHSVVPSLDDKESSMQLDDLKSQMSSLRGEMFLKMNEIAKMQSEIRSEMLNIKTNVQFLCDMMSSVKEKISEKNNDTSKDHVVGDASAVVQESKKPDEANVVGMNVVSKGKSELDTCDDLEFPCSLEPSSFNLGIGSAPPDLPDKFKSK